MPAAWRGIEAAVEAVGRVLAWLVALLVGLAFAIVLARYALQRGSVAAQEALLWLHSLVFLLGAAFALKHDRHVRIDVLYQRLAPRARACVDLFGHTLLLLPFCAFLLWISLDYVAASWASHEGSREPGGLPGVFVLKTLIPVSAALLGLQSLVLLLRSAAALRRGAAHATPGPP